MKNTTTIKIPNPLGLHARPATKLARMVKKLNVSVLIENKSGDQANAKKMFELLNLGLEKNAEIKVICDDNEIRQHIVDEILCGLGDDLSIQKTISNEDNTNNSTISWQPEGKITVIKGVPASNGLVIGKIKQLDQQQFVIPKENKGVEQEKSNLKQAIDSAKQNITTMKHKADSAAITDQSAIFDAHLALLADKDIISETITRIHNGENAPQAYKAVSDARINRLSSLDNADIAARATDVLDIRNQVMNALLGLTNDAIELNEAVIICAEDLTPSDTAHLNPNKVLGMITSLGGPTSHSAIIARGMGFPAVVALGDTVKKISDGSLIIVDGNNGCVYVNPTKQQLESAKKTQHLLQEQRKQAYTRRMEMGQTSDGHQIQIAANINKAESANEAIDLGAEGVGLMRTEFLYLESNCIPNEDIQEKAYRDMAKAMQGKPLIIRTLDIGGDKEVPYLGLASESNSFLGMRGIRLCFERPDLFIPQLRAICRVAKDYNNIHVMFPMVGKLSDWEKAKSQLDEVRKEIGGDPFPVGIMIEIPSAALIAPLLAEQVDFFSIGTNDLTQYTLAMDRMHPILSSQADALHPAVLHLIAMTAAAAKQHGKWVGVCGGAAGDKDAAKVMIGLGITELSMAAPEIAEIKEILRQYTLAELQEIAQKTLTLGSARAVRAFIQQQTK